MPTFYAVKLNTARNLLLGLPEPLAMSLARDQVSARLQALKADVPEQAVSRYRAISPPMAAVIPEFQEIVDEIELSYVLGLFFSAAAAACVSIERLLNLARIRLYPHHPASKHLHGKGPFNSWHPNISALETWGYLTPELAAELRYVYDHIRNPYLHSGGIISVEKDAKRAIDAAYQTITVFLGFPKDLFTIGAGIECHNTSDPRFEVFYKAALQSSPENGVV